MDIDELLNKRCAYYNYKKGDACERCTKYYRPYRMCLLILNYSISLQGAP